MSLLDKLKKNSKIKESSILEESQFFNDKDMTTTAVPAINIALSGSVDGGLLPGLLMVAGPSKHFKSSISLVMAAAYLKKHSDAALLFYDSEFGSPKSYFQAFGIDTNRVIHSPITDIEQLKFDIMAQLSEIKKGDRVIILIDSIGNLASKKEVEDALSEKSAADMTRAKQLKSLWRMVTPHLTMKDIPLIAINHTYQTQEIYSKAVVSGGCLVEDTKITMADGSLRNIQDVLVGEEVLTLSGSKRVSATWNPQTLVEGTPECYEMVFEDGYIVKCSDKHPFLVEDGEGVRWVAARDLTPNDNVVILRGGCE